MGGDNKGDIIMFDDSENNKICECCGAKMVTYKHKINKGATIAMKRLYDMGGKAHLELLGLTYNQRCNFQKLRYWGLAHNSDGKKNGVWELTGMGENFVEGKTAVMSHAASYRGDPVELPPNVKKYAKPVLFSEIYPYIIQDKEAVRYKQREEYADDAEPFYTG
jgi:hypothetical protein